MGGHTSARDDTLAPYVANRPCRARRDLRHPIRARSGGRRGFPFCYHAAACSSEGAGIRVRWWPATDHRDAQRPNAHATISGNSSLQNASPCDPTRWVMTTSAPAARNASAPPGGVLADERLWHAGHDLACGPPASRAPPHEVINWSSPATTMASGGAGGTYAVTCRPPSYSNLPLGEGVAFSAEATDRDS